MICWYGSPPVPFDFVGIFLEDEDVEMIEADQLAQLVGENSCQLFRFPTGRECLRDAKQRFITPSISYQRELRFWAHTFARGVIPAILARLYANRKR